MSSLQMLNLMTMIRVMMIDPIFQPKVKYLPLFGKHMFLTTIWQNGVKRGRAETTH